MPTGAALLTPHRAPPRFFAMFAALLALLAAGALPAQTPTAGDAEAARARLQELQQDIAKITAAQRSRLEQRSKLQSELRDSELELAKLRRRLARSTREIAATQADIRELSDEQALLEASLATQQEAVKREIREAYKSGGNDQLRLLLSEDDPQMFARMLAYYRYILAARSELLTTYRSSLTSLEKLREELAAREQSLSEQRATLADEEASLAEGLRQRQTILAGIESALQSDSAKLTARERDREELEQLLEEIDAALAQLIPAEDVEPFSSARGAMPWPVQGRIINRFGRPRNQGKMRWQGVRLAAEAGSPVTAIHHGRVVYADWLRGSGLLLVIDHGEGYLSLYAHNESLLREVGDWVSAGAPVSTVGNSGGQSEPALYFEIRKDGKPTDPQRWCRG